MANMEKIKVGDIINVKIEKITIGRDSKVYVTISNENFSNNPTLILRDDRFLWDSDKMIYLVKDI